jgi:tetratricopeptide (TPR) repeat protein
LKNPPRNRWGDKIQTYYGQEKQQGREITMKKLLFFAISLGLLIVIACTDLSQISGSPSAAPAFDPDYLLKTMIVSTADAAFTQTALHATSIPTTTPTFVHETSPEVTQTPSSNSFKPGDPTATPLGSEITDLNFIAGVEAFNNQEYEKAISLMNMVITSNPNLAPPYRYRGIAYLAFNRCDDALADLDQAISINPNYAHAWAGRALANDCLGNRMQKLLDFEKALSIDPSLAFVHHNLGVDYFNDENYEKSLEEYSLAVAIDPNRASAWSGKAEALFKLGRYHECIEDSSRAIEIDPTEWLAYSDRAFCKDFLGDFEGAIPDYKMYIENSADAGAPYWYNLGLAQRKTDDFDSAIASYTKALELDPAYYEAYINRGYVYLLQKKYSKALADYNRALEFGEILTAYSGRGDTYYESGEYNKAIEDYKTVLQINPSDAHAYCFLSLSYFEIEKYQDSIDAAEASRKIDAGCGGRKLDETEARSYYALKKYDQALLHINKALALGEYRLGLYYRGIIYQAAGKNQEAIQDLETFLSLPQTEDLAQEEADAKARLAKLKK